MRSNNTFYSLETIPAGVELVHVETVVSGGMYRFDIIGTTQKLASDTKHKVYTSLRASGLLNLKSDNRKITTCLRSNTEGGQCVKPQLCELAVALSCTYCIHNNKNEDTILALGELSITGAVIPSHRLIQAISLAVDNNIQYIACTDLDIEYIPVQFIEYAQTRGIHFICGSTVKEIYSNIENRVLYTLPKDIQGACTDTYISTTDTRAEVEGLIYRDVLLHTLCVSLCGDHNLLIRSDKFYNLQGLEKLINTISPQIPVSDIVSMSKTHTYTDTTIDKLHTNRLDVYDQTKKTTYTETNTSGRSLCFLSCPICPCGNPKQQCLCTQKSISLHNKKLRIVTRAYITQAFVTALTQPLSPRQYLLIQSHLGFIKNIRRLNLSRYEQLEGEKEDVYLSRILDKKGLAILKTISTKLVASDIHHVVTVSKTILFMKEYPDIQKNKTPLIQECHVLEAFNLIHKTD